MLRSDPGLHGFLNLVAAWAKETDVEIPERDYPRMSTLRACIEYLRAAATLQPDGS